MSKDLCVVHSESHKPSETWLEAHRLRLGADPLVALVKAPEADRPMSALVDMPKHFLHQALLTVQQALLFHEIGASMSLQLHLRHLPLVVSDPVKFDRSI